MVCTTAAAYAAKARAKAAVWKSNLVPADVLDEYAALTLLIVAALLTTLIMIAGLVMLDLFFPKTAPRTRSWTRCGGRSCKGG